MNKAAGEVRRTKNPDMKRTTVRLPTELHRVAKAQAAKEDVSLESWIAGAMWERIHLEEKDK